MKNRSGFFAAALSLILHGVIVGLALTFVEQIKPVLQADVFRWDVTVETMKPDPTSEEIAVATQVQPKAVIPTVQNKQVPKTPRTETPTEKPKPTQSIKEQGETVLTPKQLDEQSMLEATEREAGSFEEPKELNSATVAASSPGATLPAPSESSQNEDAIPQEVPLQNVSRENSTVAVPNHPAEAAVLSSDKQTDHRWLAELLWRRVAELKRYPNSARMNGQEGKVILKAVIRSDGQLAEVSVKKSSGHELLDAAAIEVVKLACPVHMESPIGKPQIAVSIPISYSLSY